MNRIIRFYYDGFREMTVGKKLWIIVIIKLILFFAIMKVCFFPDFLHTRFNTDRDRSEYVLDNLTKIKH
jgi:hypothetical protein